MAGVNPSDPDGVKLLHVECAPAKGQPAALAVGIIFGLTFAFPGMAIITFIQLGLCQLIEKWFFGVTGKFVELMRPLLLGWFENFLVLIPVAGKLLAGIGWTAVLMRCFEEVDGIGRLQVFGIAAGIGLLILGLQFWMMPIRHF